MTHIHNFGRNDFTRFKAFSRFSLHLRRFNILVGPNNAGKSTILAAFRILAAALRKANSRKAEVVTGPTGDVRGHFIDLRAISISEENIFYNYDDTQAASVRFALSNGNSLLLYFPPETHHCNLIPHALKRCDTPSAFRSQFNCPIGFVPILGPVEHHEQLFEKETAKLSLYNYHAPRHFRNIWHHYPELFAEFRETLVKTWPGMDIQPPEVDRSHPKPRLHMFCPEERFPREICWAGFGFQVWCQMLTHIVQSKGCSIFLIDEPDIYLHSELQRQLLGLLRNMGSDVLIATHSTEIVTEAEPDEIVLVNKGRKSARRLNNPTELFEVFAILGSNLNPVLTQLARTRRAVFVEGKDFQILGRFAHKLQHTSVGIRSGFAVVPIEGFNPQRMLALKAGIEVTLGGKILAAAVLDRDYRSSKECGAICLQCKESCKMVAIHERKEIENFLLVPEAIDRAIERRIAEKVKRTGQPIQSTNGSLQWLEQFAAEKKEYVTAQYLECRRMFDRSQNFATHGATANEAALREFNERWSVSQSRLAMIPGKEALSWLNAKLQDAYGISISPMAIIECMHVNEVPDEMRALISRIDTFSSASIRN